MFVSFRQRSLYFGHLRLNSLILLFLFILIENNLSLYMLSDTQVQIANKLGEIILQTRLDVKKMLFPHFQTFLRPLKDNPYSLKIAEFLSQLLPKDLYSIKPKIVNKLHTEKQNKVIHLQVFFTLTDRKSQHKLQAECWNIQILRLGEIGKECLPLLVDFFLQVVLVLNKLPLFSIYQKDKQIKARYMMDYKILFQNDTKDSLIETKAKDFIYRQNDSLRIKAEISYVPTLHFLKQREGLNIGRPRKESVSISDYDGQRKVSVYTFYDPDLDFTFLSSDEQSFLKKGIKTNEEIKVDIDCEECSEEFQLLIANQDEDFLNDNRDLLEYLAIIENQYLP